MHIDPRGGCFVASARPGTPAGGRLHGACRPAPVSTNRITDKTNRITDKKEVTA